MGAYLIIPYAILAWVETKLAFVMIKRRATNEGKYQGPKKARTTTPECKMMGIRWRTWLSVVDVEVILKMNKNWTNIL